MQSIVTRLMPASRHLLPAFRSSCGICGPTFTNFGKLRATATFDSSAAYDFEVPVRQSRRTRRNFKIGGTGTTRLRRPPRARSSVAPRRPSLPALNVRDDRETPLEKGRDTTRNKPVSTPRSSAISENPKLTEWVGLPHRIVSLGTSQAKVGVSKIAFRLRVDCRGWTGTPKLQPKSTRLTYNGHRRACSQKARATR
jgi:hypothetical protein